MMPARLSLRSLASRRKSPEFHICQVHAFEPSKKFIMSYLQSINENLKLESSFYRLLGTNFEITYQLHEPQTLATLFDHFFGSVAFFQVL